jgi:hypothetical protein
MADPIKQVPESLEELERMRRDCRLTAVICGKIDGEEEDFYGFFVPLEFEAIFGACQAVMASMKGPSLT